MTGSRFLAALAAVFCLLTAAGVAAAGDLLVDRHAGRGVACAACHGKAEPQARPADAVCTGCHGAYPAIAAKTAKLDPNPHASHRGELACGECHHAHKPSVDFCAQCHDFGFKVP